MGSDSPWIISIWRCIAAKSLAFSAPMERAKQRLSAWLSSEGKTVFISSHLLTEVQQICTRVGIIHLGKLITESTVEELTKGHGEFTVTLERPENALALIQAQAWGKDARIDASGAMITPAPQGRGRDLNLFLVNAGFFPD